MTMIGRVQSPKCPAYDYGICYHGHFYHAGKTPQGINIECAIEAIDTPAARVALREQSIIKLSLKRRLRPKFTWQSSITHRQMNHFMRHLATIISARITLLSCFDIAYIANRQSKMHKC